MNPTFQSLAVIIPVFNEARTIDSILSRVVSQRCVAQIIVVDDGSTDGSASRLRSWSLKEPMVRAIFHSANRGKGAAIRTAVPFVTAPYVVVQDGDLEYNPAELEPMLAHMLKRQAVAVYGSRFASPTPCAMSCWHAFGNRVLTWISNLATGQSLSDEATGYKMFATGVFSHIDLEEEGFGFCPEITAKISGLGVPIEEVGISYRARSRADGKKIRAIDGLDAIRCIVKYNLRWRVKSAFSLRRRALIPKPRVPLNQGVRSTDESSSAVVPR